MKDLTHPMRAGLWLIAFLFFAVLPACENGEEIEPAEEVELAPAEEMAADTTRLRAVYDAIVQHHDQLMAQYRAMAAQMPAEAQQMYDYMEQMHGETVQMHQHMMGDGMMGRGIMGRGMSGGMGRMGRYQTREWDHQMRAMHQQMAQYLRQQGYEDMAAQHEQMMQYYDDALAALPQPDGQEAAEEPQAAEGTVNGQNLYRQYCATCHGSSGQGVVGAFPPLAGANWVTGPSETPIRIVLHGLQGQLEVQGQSYNGMMPAFGARLSNEEAAAVLSYIRSSFGNDAPEVTPDAVGSVRQEYGNRTQPWSPSALQ